MNILVISNIEWSDANSFGNTVSNFFTGFDARFASIYRRSSMPNNDICKDYYTITPKDCLLHFFNKEKIGKAFTYVCSKDDTAVNEQCGSVERKMISFLHRFNLSFMRDVDDWLFCHCGWDNRRFRTYIEEIKPDVLFAFITASEPALQLMQAVKKYVPNCKIIASVVDDVYGVSSNAKRGYIAEQIAMVDRLYGASAELCRVYEKQFGRTFTPLYKGCTFDTPVAKKPMDIMHLVYAGNLYYGRADTLAALAAAIAHYNKKNIRQAELHIYTSTEVSESMRNKLNLAGASTLCEARPYTEIKQIMAQAHVVLHVESFDQKQIEVVRYSFSTKLIDCFQSGSVLMVIGPGCTASVRYAGKVPGAVSVTDLDALDDTITNLASSDLFAMAQQTRAFALKNHDSESLRVRLMEEFQKTIIGDNAK